jgi:hypothetical protein
MCQLLNIALSACAFQVPEELCAMEKNFELAKRFHWQSSSTQVAPSIASSVLNRIPKTPIITDKEASMQLAQTWLATCTRRPKVEACIDPVQHRCVKDILLFKFSSSYLSPLDCIRVKKFLYDVEEMQSVWIR